MSAVDTTPAARSFPWYDSQWLAAWHDVRDHLACDHPDHLAEFEEATSVFRTRSDFTSDWVDLIDGSTHRRLVDRAEALTGGPLERHERIGFGRDVCHDDPVFTEIQIGLEGPVGELVGEPVETHYNFLSLYDGDGTCPPHLDAPEAKWTIDHCLGRSEPWGLHVSRVVDWPDGTGLDLDWQRNLRGQADLEFATFEQRAGDTIAFAGSSQWHFRDPFPTNTGWGHFLFFHYIPAGTAELVRPTTWAQRFALPCLAPLTARTAW